MRQMIMFVGFRALASFVMATGVILAMGSSTEAVAQQQKSVEVYLDRAEVTAIPARTSTLVIGNPMIADANVQPGGLLVITGKGLGSTNVMALDAQGVILSNMTVRVRVSRNETVQVYRGTDRETYQCSPMCEPVVTLGDSKDYFDKSLGQNTIRMKNALEQSGERR